MTTSNPNAVLVSKTRLKSIANVLALHDVSIRLWTEMKESLTPEYLLPRLELIRSTQEEMMNKVIGYLDGKGESEPTLTKAEEEKLDAEVVGIMKRLEATRPGHDNG